MLALPPAVLAEPGLRLHAVFGERAVLSVDGERAVIAPGETGPGGLQVLRTRPGAALVQYRGERHELRVRPAATGLAASSAGGVELRVHRDSRGDHAVTAGVNGIAITLVVDRGVDSVLLRAADAERAGIDPDTGRSVRIQREHGYVHGQRVRIERLQVGALRQAGVTAIVLPDAVLPRSRLGRSFLEHFEVTAAGDALVIRER
nr:TIGR02281 family clan AA aspartic protease [Thioalkalivibrio sp. ALJT]